MWLWRFMYGGVVLGFAILTMTFIFFLWFMFEVGFAWVSLVLIALVAWMVFSAVKNRKRYAGFDIRR